MDTLDTLYKCIEYGDVHLAEQILNDKEAPLIPSKLNTKVRGQAALHLVAKHGNDKILELILSKAESSVINVNIHDDFHKLTPLMVACQKGHIEIVKILLRLPECNVNEIDSRGSTALHFASVQGSLEIVRLLVERGASISVKNHFGNTAFHRAAAFDNVEIIRYLLKVCEKIGQKAENIVEVINGDMQRMIHCASLNGCFSTVKYLVEECHADIEAKDKNDNTSLHIAADNSHEDIVNLLIRNSANVDCRDLSLETPLMKASYKGFLNIVRILHKNNSNLNLKERSSGMTALMFAALHNQIEVVEYLANNGASINLENHEGKTALHYVAIKSFEGAAILLAKDADPLHQDINKITPLSLAEKHELDDLVQLMHESIKKTQSTSLDSEKDSSRNVVADSDDSSTKKEQPKRKQRRISPPQFQKKRKELTRPPSSSNLPTKKTSRKRSDSHSSREDSVGKSSKSSPVPQIQISFPKINLKTSGIESPSSASKKKKKSAKKKPKTPSSISKKKPKYSKKDKVGQSLGVGNEDSEQEQGKIESSLVFSFGDSEQSSPGGSSAQDSPQTPSSTTGHSRGDSLSDIIDKMMISDTKSLNDSDTVKKGQESKMVDSDAPEPDSKMMRLQSLTPASEAPITWSEAGHVLGRGAFGEVVLGICEDGTLIAVKRLGISNSNWKRVEKEVRLLQRLKHHHICRYIGCQLSDDGHSSLDILLEYCSEGTLNSFMRKIKRTGVRLRTLQIYMKQILLGLKYIHDLGLLHRDLKPDNILIHSSGLIKIADFGCSKVLEESLSTVSQQGTPEFLSAELIKDEIVKGYEKAIDVWAIGILTWELACGRSIWKDMGFTATNRFALMFKVASLNSDPELPDRLKLPSLRDFIGSCLRIDPRKRLTTDELLKHPFLTDVSFHNMRDEDILEDFEDSTSKEHVNLLSLDSSGNLKEDRCLGSINDESLCRLDSICLK